MEYQKQYYIENKEKIEIYRKQYYKNNSAKIIEKQNIRDKNHKEEKTIYNKQYRATHKIKKTKPKTLETKLRQNISNAIYQNLKHNGSTKAGKSILKFLPYTIKELKNYIESIFEPWMNWNNRGSYNPKTWSDNDSSTWVWNLDHIIPHSNFQYTSMEDESFKQCWALSNLRPLSAKKNIYDGATKIRHVEPNL